MEPTKQQEITIDYKENAVIIAAPGSGKTFVLSEKIKQILLELKEHQGIIAISYTNKASNELKERSLKNGIDPKSSFFGTIDKFFISEIVSPFGKQLFGLPKKSFTVITIDSLDETEAREFNWFSKELTIENLSEDHVNTLKKYYKEGILLLDTIGILGNYIFTNSTSCKKYFKAKYKYIFIDEYQDSGINQHAIFLKICDLNIFGVAVGDLNQSIYAFSGKDAKYLNTLTKSQKFKLFKLTKNHRCHPSIINYSNYLLDPKTAMIPAEKSEVYYQKVKGNEAEIAAWVDKSLASIKKIVGVEKNNAIAILTRGNRTADILKNNLKTPSKVSLTTALDFSLNAWSGIFSNLLNFVYNKSYKFIEVVEEFTTYDKLSKAERKKIIELKLEVVNLFTADKLNLESIIDVFRSIATIIAPNSFNDESLDLLNEVLCSPNQLHSYKPAKDDEISIMTLHKSKGLEFEVVVHLDLYEWVLPFGSKGVQRKNNLREWVQDLNLHYVGITRAKKACILLVGTQRTNNQGETLNAVDSEFLWQDNIETLRYAKPQKAG